MLTFCYRNVVVWAISKKTSSCVESRRFCYWTISLTWRRDFDRWIRKVDWRSTTSKQVREFSQLAFEVATIVYFVIGLIVKPLVPRCKTSILIRYFWPSPIKKSRTVFCCQLIHIYRRKIDLPNEIPSLLVGACKLKLWDHGWEATLIKLQLFQTRTPSN
jgi:hypothetical protein